MFTKMSTLILFLSLLLFTVPASAASPRPVIIDTDMTTDDFMAILYMMNNPDFEIKAITVTGTGWSFCDAGVEMALGLLALNKYGDVPVSCWKDTPLMGGDNPVPAEYRTSLETVKSFDLPAGGKASDLDAVKLFTKTVQDTQNRIEVLALGPLTNIAKAFTTTPALLDKIERITVMGGAVDTIGNASPLAEWNIYCDPPAARIVFESGAPITLVALDASNDVPVTLDFLDRLDKAKKATAAIFVAKALTNSSDFIKSGTYYFWDPLAAVVMANPDLVTHTERSVSVMEAAGREYGRTKPVKNGARIDVVTKPDGKVLEQLLIDTWNTETE